MNLDEKRALLSGWLTNAAELMGRDIAPRPAHVLAGHGSAAEEVGHSAAFVRDSNTAAALRLSEPAWTVCCIEDKTCAEQLSALEHRVRKFFAGNKARFYPVG